MLRMSAGQPVGGIEVVGVWEVWLSGFWNWVALVGVLPCPAGFED